MKFFPSLLLNFNKCLILLKIFILFNSFALSQPLGSDLNTDPSDFEKSDFTNELDFLKYASHVFKPNLYSPVKSFKREPSEEKQIDKLDNSNIEEEIVEGDILTRKNVNSYEKTRFRRKIVNEIDRRTNQPTRWPNKIVPYEYDPSFPQDMRNLVNQAILHWHKYTCIRFEPYSQVRHRNYRSRLYIQPANICGTFIGYIIEKNVQVAKSTVYLGKDCLLGNIIHELGHTIGFRHEHSRIDRDNHISINFNKISSALYGQYSKMDDSQPNYYSVPYDLYSIMHYSAGADVISALDPNRNFLMGQREKLSFLDIQTANSAYKCSEKCPAYIVCQNGGFVDQNCICMCPEGITGSFCESIIDTLNYADYSIEAYNLAQTLDCNFNNNDYCKWSNDKTHSAEDWIFNKPNTGCLTEAQLFFKTRNPNFKTGPQNGDRQGNKNGNYIYINSLRKSGSNSNAVLSTPKIRASTRTQACLKFWYNMYQSVGYTGYPLQIGNLSVNIRQSNGVLKKLWFKAGNQGINWNLAQVEIQIEPPMSAIYFEAFFKDYSYGDICLDDIQVVLGPCSVQNVNFFKRDCFDSNNQTISCEDSAPKNETDKCADASCRAPIFSDWSEWSNCTKGCESYRFRARKCLNSDLGQCTGETVEYAICSKCNAKRLIFEKQLFEDDQTQFVENLGEWSEWSACFLSKTVCDTKIQVRRRKCSKKNCISKVKELRDCDIKPTVDMKHFCKNKHLKLELDFGCRYGLITDRLNNSTIEDCNLLNQNSSVKLLEISKHDKLGSLILDNHKLDKPHFIHLFINSSVDKSQNFTSACAKVYISNLNEYEYKISFFYLTNNSIYSKLEDTVLESYPNHTLKSLSSDIPVENGTEIISLMMQIEISKILSDFKAENYTGLIIKSVFVSKNSCFRNQNNSTDEEEEDDGFDKRGQDGLSLDNTFSSSCGGLLNFGQSRKLLISSPNYPYQYPTNVRCNYLVKSPPGTTITVKSIDLDLEKTSKDSCVDSLEFRYYHLGQPGPVFCGTIHNQSQLSIKSTGNFLMIIFRTDWAQTVVRRGFRLEAEYF